LQHKPALPTPDFAGAADAGVAVHGNRGKVFDPFSPPYNANLFVGELKDNESEEEFVVLVNRIGLNSKTH